MAQGQLFATLANPLELLASTTLAYGYKINIVTIIAFINIRVLKS
jgi:hypothetical protein